MRFMAWVATDKSDAEIKKAVDAAVQADTSRDYERAVDLYADAIEGMMRKLQRTSVIV